MKKILICEGRTDAIVLRTVLRASNMDEVQVLEGGGKSSAISLGTSFALNGVARVAIVVDADTTDPDRLDEQHLIFNDLMPHNLGSGSCRLLLAVPTLEGALFPTAEEFASTFGLRLTPRQIERYNQHWNLVVRAFLTPPAPETATMIKTKGIPRAALDALLQKPLLRELERYLREE